MIVNVSNEGRWLIYIDRSHGKLSLGIGCLIVTPSGEKIEKVVSLGFEASNNETKYEDVIYALQTTKAMAARNISCSQIRSCLQVNSKEYILNEMQKDGFIS